MKETIRVLLSEEEVDRRIKEVADQINCDYAGKEVHLICVLKGGVFFMCELAKRITVPVSLDFMSVSSYGDDTKSSGVVRIVKDLDQPLEGKDVLIVEDIIDSGRTLYYLIDILKKRNPKSVHLCTLLDKPERRVCGGSWGIAEERAAVSGKTRKQFCRYRLALVRRKTDERDNQSIIKRRRSRQTN